MYILGGCDGQLNRVSDLTAYYGSTLTPWWLD